MMLTVKENSISSVLKLVEIALECLSFSLPIVVLFLRISVDDIAKIKSIHLVFGSMLGLRININKTSSWA